MMDTIDQEQLQFLRQVLTTIEKCGNNREEVVHLLQANLDKLNLNLVPLLQHWSRFTLGLGSKIVSNTHYAALVTDFGNFLWEFPQGDKKTNIEVSIVAHEIAANVFAREDSTELLAAVENSLGLAYTDRISGDPVQNLEQAINYLEHSLSIRSEGIGFVQTLNNLGRAYRKRILGNPIKNLKKAINIYEMALEAPVNLQKETPDLWATIQNNLANAYSTYAELERLVNLDEED